MTMGSNGISVNVVGGGVIGLACAWRLAREGCTVALFERDTVGKGASRIAAGMLAPVSEYGFDDDDFLALSQASVEDYPAFLDELREDSGVEVTLDRSGALTVALHRDDAEANRRLFDFRTNRGLAVEWLTGTEAREREPLLSPRVSSAMWIPDDWHVDNRALLEALEKACHARGVTIHENTRVEKLATNAGRVIGIETENGTHTSDVTLLTAGSWSGEIAGTNAQLPVRPVKGQIVSLTMNDYCRPSHVIRTPDAYLVPKPGGRLLVGATQEEMGFDTAPTAGPVMRLIERAWEAVPGIYDLPIESIDVGLRPGTRDHLPIIGPCAADGLFVATGHFRHGILLAPVTARIVAESLVTGAVPAAAQPFSPSRFRATEHRSGTQG